MRAYRRNPDAGIRELERAAREDPSAATAYVRSLERSGQRPPAWALVQRYVAEGAPDPYMLKALRFAASGMDNLVTYPTGRQRRVQNLNWLLRNTYRSGGSMTGRLLPLRFVVRSLPTFAERPWGNECYLLVELSDGTRTGEEAYEVRTSGRPWPTDYYHSSCYQEATKSLDSPLRGATIRSIHPHLPTVCAWCNKQDPFAVTHTFETLWASCEALWGWLQRPTFENEALDWDGRVGQIARPMQRYGHPAVAENPDVDLRELERRASTGGVADAERFAVALTRAGDPRAADAQARVAFLRWTEDRKNKDLARAYGEARTAVGYSASSPYNDWNRAAEEAGKPLVMQPMGGLPRGLRSWLLLNEDQTSAIIQAAPEKHRTPAPKKKPRRLKVAEAEKIVKAWLRARGWRPDTHPSSTKDVWISEDGRFRVIFKRSALRFESGGRGGWSAWGYYQPYMETLRTIDFANYLLAIAKRGLHHAAPNPGGLVARAKRGDRRAQEALFRKAVKEGRVSRRDLNRLVAGCDAVALSVTGESCGERELLEVVGRKNRFNSEQAGKVIRAHYYEQGWEDDPRSRGKGLISPDGKAKIKLTARTWKRLEGSRGKWKQVASGSKIELAEDLVAKARR